MKATENDRPGRSAATHRRLVAGLALAILASAVTIPRDTSTPPSPPVSQCSDFGCEK